jgi:tartrate dehydratase alpha subunit/fumarate hydratase class I-like protein
MTHFQVLSDAIKGFANFVAEEAPKYGRSPCPRNYIGMQFVQIGASPSHPRSSLTMF